LSVHVDTADVIPVFHIDRENVLHVFAAILGVVTGLSLYFGERAKNSPDISRMGRSGQTSE
jgi:hypothetical protein